MKLRVIGNQNVLVGHTIYLTGEIFEITDSAGNVALAQHPQALRRVDSQEEQPFAQGGAEDSRAEGLNIQDMQLSGRVMDALSANGIKTADGLRLAVERGDDEMLEIPGIGPRALEEIKAALEV